MVVTKPPNTQLPSDWLDFLRSKRPAVLFGAGRQATIVHDFCLMHKKPVFCLMTSGDRSRWGFLPKEDALPLYTVEEFPADIAREEYDLVVALAPHHNAHVAGLLRRNGWPNVLFIDDWETVNAATRKAFYDDYFTRRGASFSTDAEGCVYLKCPGKYGMFRIYYDIDPLYNANLLGVLNNIVLPSVFDDFSCCSAVGAYEFGLVTMRPGDTVFAAGAGIGVFSCAAASRGCRVHAFEPTPLVVKKYLAKNAALNPSVTVVPKALLDAPRMTGFYINDSYAHSLNLTRHSIFPHLEPSYSRIEVEATSIDAYVKENRIDRVDFLRSFSEYSERYVFAGAGDTLRRDAPALSYCYFDKKSAQQTILQANPDYHFADKAMQSFAWVPGTTCTAGKE